MSLESFLAHRVQLLMVSHSCKVSGAAQCVNHSVITNKTSVNISSSLAEIKRNSPGIRVRHFGAVLWANTK
jgi:hypothetical protein